MTSPVSNPITQRISPILPRFIRLRDANFYLGMDRNRFNSEVRPYVTEVRIGARCCRPRLVCREFVSAGSDNRFFDNTEVVGRPRIVAAVLALRTLPVTLHHGIRRDAINEDNVVIPG
jgi:hypothetical protein